MKTVNALSVLGKEIAPSEDGVRLAKWLISQGLQSLPDTIDVTDLAPENLVSSFVNSLLHTLEQAGADRDALAGIRWISKFESEERRMLELVQYYMDYRDRDESGVFPTESAVITP